MPLGLAGAVLCHPAFIDPAGIGKLVAGQIPASCLVDLEDTVAVLRRVEARRRADDRRWCGSAGARANTSATACGFAGRARFHQLFRRHAGTTPLAYRRACHGAVGR